MAINLFSGGNTINSLQAAGKNKIINGDFGINQRAFTSTTTSAAYGFDRWQLSWGGGTATYSAQTFTPGTAPVAGYEGINYARLVTSGQSAAGDYAQLVQPIEDVRTFAGQTVTVSFWAQAASGTPSVGIEMYQVFGSGGSPSAAVTAIGATKTAITTSWARYSVSFAVPSISGKTIGTTANTSYIALALWTSAGSTYNARTGSLGIQNTTINFWGVQVELGTTATTFTTATGTIQGELAACQRYFYRLQNGASLAATGNGTMYTSASAYPQHAFPTIMRTVPSLAVSSATGGIFYYLNANSTTTSIGLGATSTRQAEIGFNFTSVTAGTGGAFFMKANEYLDFSAEL